MTKRILAALLALGVVVAGLAVAQDPADKDEPPLRLKKKPKKPAQPAEAEPGKPDPKEPAPAKPKEEAGKKKDAEDNVPEMDPEQEVDEQEVLNRVAKNMRSVEEKLANRELNEGTEQTQDDILKDIDSLIRKAQSPSGGGADQKQDRQDQQDQQNQAENNQAGKKGQAQPKPQPGGGKKAGRRQRGAWKQARGKGRQGRGQRGQKSQMARGQKPGTQGNGSGGGKNPKPNKSTGNGKTPGGGGNTAGGGPDRTADLYKNVWGHLPESLRAEMNAYSNPRPFLPQYDELIKRYYRTIAEQGKRKGD